MMITGRRRAADAEQRRVAFTTQHRALVLESCACALLAVFLLALTRFPLVTVTIGLVLAGLAVAAVSLGITDNGWFATSIAAWSVVLPGWLLYARISHQPFSSGSLVALLVIGVLLTGWTYLTYAGLIVMRWRAKANDDDHARRAVMTRWAAMFAGLGVDGVTATADKEGRGGRVVTLMLPASGRVTIRHLHGLVDGVAAALHLQPGSVRFEQGSHAAEVVMHLDVADILAEEVLFPRQAGAITVTKPFPVGVSGSGAEATILWREAAILIVGVRGAGKSNLLNVLIAQLTRCTDVVVFGIDLAGGRLFAPWIRPWINGACERPAVDWVATTREEAHLLLTAVDAVVAARDSSLIGGSKIEPTPDLPQIVVICDEVTDILGSDVPRSDQGATSNYEFAALMGRLVRKSRKAAVEVALATQRGTVTMLGSGDLKSQMDTRISLGSVSEADARSVMPDDTAAARLIAALQHPGTGTVWRRGQRGVEPVKFYRLDPAVPADLNRIHALAEVAGHTRPAPDPLAQQAMGDGYTRRWERSELYQRVAADSPAADELRQLPHPMKPAPPPVPLAQDADQNADEFRAMLERAGMLSERPDPRGRMYALLAELPQFGLSVVEIGSKLTAEGIGVARETIHGWLREDLDKGVVFRRGKAGTVGARYVLTLGKATPEQAQGD